MSNGVLCFANNNGKINYILQAQELAKRVRKYLDLPTSIVTSTPCQVDESYFDKVIHSEHPMGNFKRSLYYTLDRDMLHKIDKAKLVFLLEKENLHGEYVLSATNNMNVHVMNKFSLERLLNV